MGEVFKLNHCYNVDCLQAMELFPDNYFDLAAVFLWPGTQRLLRIQSQQNRRTP